MRDIHDPTSPYYGQYEDWDYWLFARAYIPSAEESRQLPRGEWREGWRLDYVGVDAQGYVIPALLSLSEDFERERPQPGKPPASCVCSFMAYGPSDPAIEGKLEQAELHIAAQYYARIPDWLGTNPPVAANILPDGKVATLGPLGSDDGQGAWIKLETGWQERELPWYLYSAEGQLLRQTGPGGWREDLFEGRRSLDDPLATLGGRRWVAHLFAEARENGWDRGYLVERGYLLLTSDRHQTIEAVYDYDGTPLPADFNIWSRDNNKLSQLEGPEIRRIYAAQQEMSREQRAGAGVRTE